MDKTSTEPSTSGTPTSTMAPTERRNLNELTHSSKRSGGNYGSLAKSQIQATYYICHKVEPDDTMQRLALKYGINIQDIKRVNKLWSDAELSLLENVYIAVSSSQISTLRTLYPTLNIVHNVSPTTNRTKQSCDSEISNDGTMVSISTSESSNTVSTLPTAITSYEDYFSKIDQQIRTSKKSLQSFDINKHSDSRTNQISSSSDLTNGNKNNELNSSSNNHTIWNSGRNKGTNYLLNNSIFVNVATQNTREKHISAALERIQREQDDFDEL